MRGWRGCAAACEYIVPKMKFSFLTKLDPAFYDYSISPFNYVLDDLIPMPSLIDVLDHLPCLNGRSRGRH